MSGAKPDPENFRGGPVEGGPVESRFGIEVPQCRACLAVVIWAKMPSGKMNPLDAAETPPEPKKGVIAFNPATNGGVPVTLENAEECARWAESGVTFHVSHFATCPQRARFKR